MHALLLLTASLLAQQATVDDAMRLAAQGRLPESQAILQQLVAVNPKDADLRYRLGLILTKQNAWKDAERELQQAVTLQPGFVFAWLALGDVHLRSGDKARAMRDAAAAEKLAANTAPAWKALAFLRGRLDDAQGEAAALQNLLRLASEERGAYARLANLLLEHRNVEAAERVAATGLKRFPSDAELLRLRGLACYGAGRKSEAIDAFLEAMDAAPDNDLVHSSIETLLPDAGDRLPAIVQRLRRYREKRRDAPMGPYLLALAIPAQKMSLLKEALSIDASFWPAWFELHRVFREQGKPSEAMAALKKTIELKPDHELAHFALAELYLAAGDRTRAREHRAIHHKLRSAASPAPIAIQ